MRTTTLASLGLLAYIAAPAAAQDPQPARPTNTTRPAQPAPPTQEQLVALRTEKLAKPVFQKADWTFDYDAARTRAKAEGKLIFAYFTRSYAH